MSLHKFGRYVSLDLKLFSNVIEKCLKFSDSRHREQIIAEIIGESGFEGTSGTLADLIKDSFGNYVI